MPTESKVYPVPFVPAVKDWANLLKVSVKG